MQVLLLNFKGFYSLELYPNLSRIGLLTDKVRPLYDKLGVLDSKVMTDGDISWAELEKPLDLSA